MCAPVAWAATARFTSTGRHRLRVGPRKAMPLSLLAHAAFPPGSRSCARIAELERLPEHRDAVRAAQSGPRRRRRICPRSSGACGTPWISSRDRVSTLVRSGSGLEALRRLADAGLATLAAFTPSDAMHVLDRQTRVVPRGRRMRRTHPGDRGAQCACRRAAVLAAGDLRTDLRARGARDRTRAAGGGARARSGSRGARARLGCARRPA